MQDSQGNLYSRGDCQIQKNRKYIEDFLKNMNLRNKYDEMFKELKTLKEYSEQELELVYCRFKAQWPVDDRDFVLVQGYVRENSTSYVVATSIDYKDPNIPVDKKTVRGVLMAGGWILQEINSNLTKTTYISCSDPKGKIPETIKNYAAKM